MKRVPVISVVCLAITLAAGPGATDATAGSYGTELPFVAGTGARSSGMGLATVSLFGTPSGHCYNPSLLVGHDYKQFEFYRTTLFDSESQYHAFSYIHPSLDWGTLGISVLRLDVGGVENRDAGNNLLGSLENAQTRVLLGFGTQVHPLLAVGANLKIDRQSFGEASGSGIGFDVGLLFQRDISAFDFLDRVRVGFAIENMIEPSVKLDQEGVPDPMRLTVGASVDGRYRELGFSSALDVVNPRTSPPRVRFGQEVTYTPYFAFRFGFDASTPTAGFGARYQSISLDYAFRDEELGANHRLSLSVSFGASRAERLDLRRQRLDEEMQARVRRTVSNIEDEQVGLLVTRADSLFDAGKFDRARDRYELVLVWDPSSQHAQERVRLCERNDRVATAEASMERGDYLDALHQLRQALQLAPDHTRLDDLIEQCEAKINEAQDRTRLIERLLSTSIDLYAQDRYVEAHAGFKEVLRLDPDNKIAVEYEHKSATNIENSYSRHLRSARTLAAQSDFDGAASELRRALTFKPGDRTASSELTDVEQRRATQQAAADTPPAKTPATAPKPSVDTTVLDRDFSAGVRLLEQGRFGDAAQTLSQVWAAAPGHRNVAEPLTKAYLFHGMQLYSQGRYEDAIQVWERVLTIDPGNVKAKRYLEKSRQEADRLSGGSR